MNFGLREMQFELSPRYKRTLLQKLKKIQKHPNIEINITVPKPDKYIIQMKSNSQDFITLQAALRHIVKGPIERRIL